MLNPKHKSFLIAAALLLCVGVLAGGILYFAEQQKNPAVSQPLVQPVSDAQADKTGEANPKQVEAQKVYNDQQLNYSLALPDGWIVKEVRSYPSISLDGLIKKFNPDWRSLEVARVYIASNASLADCLKLARGIDSCSVDSIRTGAYVSVTVDYREEATVDEVVARDVQEIGASFAPADMTIASQKTFTWSNAPVCKDCPFSKTYIFNAKPHFTYEVTEELYQNPKEQLSDEARAQYMRDLKAVITSLELR